MSRLVCIRGELAGKRTRNLERWAGWQVPDGDSLPCTWLAFYIISIIIVTVVFSLFVLSKLSLSQPMGFHYSPDSPAIPLGCGGVSKWSSGAQLLAGVEPQQQPSLALTNLALYTDFMVRPKKTAVISSLTILKIKNITYDRFYKQRRIKLCLCGLFIVQISLLLFLAKVDGFSTQALDSWASYISRTWEF